MAAFDVFIKVGSMEANGGQRQGADSNIGHCICVDSNGGHYIGADSNAHAHQPPHDWYAGGTSGKETTQASRGTFSLTQRDYSS